MTQRTFTIELRVNLDAERLDIIKHATLVAARNLLAQSMLLIEKDKPQIACYSSDFLKGTEEIEVTLDDVGE